MGWSRYYINYDDLGEDRRGRGYSYKLCPYSTAYRDMWRFEGPLCIGTDNLGNQIFAYGTLVVGNSNNDGFFGASYDTYECSVHTTTSGRMVTMQNPPGWICDDPNCYYFTTVASGRMYSEV